MPRRTLAAVLALVFTTGCASAPKKLSPYGRDVTVVTTGAQGKVRGELLAVGQDRLWVRGKEGVTEVPLPEVKEIKVRRHGFGGQAAMTWALVGGLVTGGALGGACASVEDADNCGGVALVTAGAWLLVGALAAPAMESSSQEHLSHPVPDQVRPFARLPQGLPEGVDPASLAETKGSENR
jgi:hypothetical protein